MYIVVRNVYLKEKAAKYRARGCYCQRGVHSEFPGVEVFKKEKAAGKLCIQSVHVLTDRSQ